MNDVAKVLGIFGSPRRGGNTDLLLKETLKGAAAEGARAEEIRLCDFRITPCRECLSCFNDGACVIPDDMQGIYPRLLKADIVILASPIFFYGITGWAKAMVDRSQALWARKYKLHDPALETEHKRKGFFVSVGGTKGQRMFEGAVLTVRYFFDAFNTEYSGDLLFRGVDACGDILKNPDALSQASSAGRKLVSDLRMNKVRPVP
ncbi:MAG: flavodoxin family protein [Syntrophus sp. (in: bacteria)]|nr:flavodoxin family protein [Syntrophus sp. (in: bacteria)]